MKLRTSHILSILLLFALLMPLQAKDFSKEEIRKNLPKMLGANNVGREFYFTFIPCWETPAQGNDLKLYISSGVRTKVVVTIAAAQYEKIKYTVPNDIIEYNLSPAQGQPYRKTDRVPPEPDQIWKGAGIHIKADDPIICYGVTRYQYTSDGFLCIPVPALGKEYIIATYGDPSPNTIQWLPASSGITAAYDKTKVKFTMGGTDWSKTAGGLLPNETSSWNMNAGDVLMISGLGSHADMSGSIVSATKPVSVVSGNFCAYIPTNCGCCDVVEEMELPTNTWGTEYHVTRIINRLKNSMIKIFAKEAKTKVYRDFAQIGYIRTAGGVEGVGHLHIRADGGLPRPIVFSGDKPIGVTQFNTGQGDDNIVSDPFQLVLTPVEQYQREIIFNTPGIRGGFGFPQNYLNICYQATPQGTIPDDLEFATVVAGKFEWQKLVDMSASPGNPFTKLPGGKIFYSKTLTLPGDGVYKLRGAQPFAAYAYGFSSYDSYGFPTSVALGDLTKPDTVPPLVPWLINCFGNVNDPDDPTTGSEEVRDLPEDADFRSNLADIYMDSELSFNYELVTNEFMPCEDQTAVWQLKCLDPSEDARAVLYFSDCAGNTTDTVIDYTAPRVKLVEKEWDYGRHSIGDKSEKVFYLINYHDTKPWFVVDLKLKNNDEGFSMWEMDGVTPLPSHFVENQGKGRMILPMDTLKFIVRFEATKEGEFWDSIGYGDTCLFFYKSYVEANVGSPIILVSDYKFNPINVGGTAFGNFNVRNVGTVNLDIYSFTGPFTVGKINGKPIYGFPNGGLKDEKFPMSLKPNEIRNFEISFSPDDTIKYPDSIVFASNTVRVPTNGYNADSVCVLDGSGLQAGLIANSHDWERKRIDRPTHPVAAYPPPADIITLFNPGNNDIKITNVKQKVINGSASSFLYAPADFYISLLPGESKVIPVSFKPTAIGFHEIELEFITDKTIDGTVTGAPITATSNLRGTGIMPKIEITNISFGTTIVNDYEPTHEMEGEFTIKCLDTADGYAEYDSCEIKDLSGVGVRTNLDAWDTPGVTEAFKWIPFITPVWMQPGESKTYKGYFLARQAGNVNVSMKTTSDAETEVTTLWDGAGLEPNITISGSSDVICDGEQSNLTITIENTGQTPMHVEALTKANDVTNNFIDSPQAFDLQVGEKKIVGVRFDPDDNLPGETQRQYSAEFSTNATAFLTVSTDLSTRVFPLTQSLSGEGTHYERNLSINPPGLDAKLINIGDFTVRKVMLDPGDNLASSKLKGMQLTITYSGDFLMLGYDDFNSELSTRDAADGKDGIILGSMFDKSIFHIHPDKTTIVTDEATKMTTLSLQIDRINDNLTPTNFITSDGEILALTLKAFLPKADTRVSVFDVKVIPIEEDMNGVEKFDEVCVTLHGATGSIAIDSTCVFAIRKIVFNNGQFYLGAVAPSPVKKGQEAKAEFSVALQDCHTRIEVYNSANQLVAVPVDRVLQPGSYEMNIPVNELTSGAYYYIMKSGPFEAQERFIIAK